jgi:heme O synthase-like polyprenyltransferase
MAAMWMPTHQTTPSQRKRASAASEFAQSVMYLVLVFAFIVIAMQGEIR